MFTLGIRARLALLLGLMSVVLAGLGAYSLGQLRESHATLATVFDDRVVPLRQLQRVGDAHAHTSEVVRQLREGQLTPPQAVQSLRQAGEVSRREWQAYLTTYLVPEESALIEQARPLLARGEAARERVIALIEDGDLTNLLADGEWPVGADTLPLTRVFDQLADLQVRVAQEALASTRVAEARVFLGLVVGVGLALVVGTGLVMWTAWQYGCERLAAERAAQRQAGFYAALSHTNQLIVRERDMRVLYAETCRICVDAGHAALACIWQLGPEPHGGLLRVRFAGPFEQLLGAVDPAVPVAAQQGPVLKALREGHSAITQTRAPHAFDDAPHQRLLARGITEVAAFPIRRGGVVVAALTLYVREEGFFDAPLLALLDEMVGDIGFALDTIDRNAEHAAAVLALAENEARLNGIVESALDAVISIDTQRRIVLFNSAASRMLRVAPEDAIGTHVDRFVPPERLAADHAFFEAFARGEHAGTPRGRPTRLVTVRGDGERFPIELMVSRSGEGERMLMSLVFSDLSERIEAEQAREARLVAETASRAKTDFLSRMSHELRTPLNAVLGFSQILQNDDTHTLSDSQRQQVEAIRQAGWHLLSLINDVLDVSRIESGQMQVQARSVLIASAVAEVVPLVRAQAEALGVSIEVADFPEQAQRVWCDPLRLRQVLLNLLSNAVKYNRPGGSVRVSAQAGEALLSLHVSDTGQGMTPEQLQHLFEPFNRLGRESSAVEGTGIGMALARQLVELMQGRIEVESEAGQGTVVRVFLPPAPAGDTPADEVLAPATPTPIDEPQGTVLYIEDNPINVIVVEQMLARWRQLTFVQASDGNQGIELARSLQPDLVLLDMRLPDMDGPAVLRALQSDPTTRSLRVVALSASAMPDEVEAARSCGAFDYWTKPLDFDRFLADMRRLLSRG